MNTSKTYVIAYANLANPDGISEFTETAIVDLGALRSDLEREWERMWLRCRETIQEGTV